MAVLFIGLIILSGFLYHHTMKLINAIIHGIEKEMEPRLVSDSLIGAVLCSIVVYLLVSFN